MRMKGIGHRRVVLMGALMGVGLGLSGACAGKGKGSKNPEQCMSACEQEQCAYDANSVGNDEYLECLDACQGKCS